MQLKKVWARRCCVAMLASATAAAWAVPPPATSLDPNGVYTGEVKCDGVSSDGDVRTKRTVTIGIPHMDGSTVMAIDDLGGLGGHYKIAWFPQADGKKGTASFYAFNDVDFVYSETGMAKIDAKKDGKRSFDGDSLVFVNSVDAGRVGAACEWKLKYLYPYEPSQPT
jgi:hypothetical protein